MTANEYQKACLRTMSRTANASRDNAVLQGVMGLCGEAGEAIDIVKKYLFQGHPLGLEEEEHLMKECGDALWYIATMTDALGYTLEDVMKANIEKLKSRYPNGFDAEHSIARKDGDI